MKTIFKPALACSMVVMLAACSDGNNSAALDDLDDVVSDSAIAGFYTGTATDVLAVQGVVSARGDYFVFYGPGEDEWSGFIQGSGTAVAGNYTSDTGTDFNLTGGGNAPVSVEAQYEAKTSIAGNFSYDSGSVPFAATYSSMYEKEMPVGDLQGSYFARTFTSSGNSFDKFDIAEDGKITGSFRQATGSSCSMTGAVTPQATGSVFDISVKFGGEGCTLSNKELNGILLPDERPQRFLAGAYSADRAEAIIIQGSPYGV